jgi:hypothetical protein
MRLGVGLQGCPYRPRTTGSSTASSTGSGTCPCLPTTGPRPARAPVIPVSMRDPGVTTSLPVK